MRRKEFKCIANGFAKHLASRNNDYEGYWSLGQLLSISKQLGTETLSLQISDGRCEMNTPELNTFAKNYWVYLTDKVESIGGRSSWIQDLVIEFTFSITPRRTYSFWGEALMKYDITVTLKSDLGREFTANSAGYCVSHNPNKEQRRVHF